MKDLMVPIDQAGRIVLPKDVRLELAIKPGDTFKISIHGASVTLTPNKEVGGLIRKGKALVFAASGHDLLTNEAVEHLLEEAREAREDVGQLFSRDKRRRP